MLTLVDRISNRSELDWTLDVLAWEDTRESAAQPFNVKLVGEATRCICFKKMLRF
jgi:hypothetical protein